MRAVYRKRGRVSGWPDFGQPDSVEIVRDLERLMIPILTYRMPGVSLCTCIIEVRIGWGHEPPADRGLVHLLEHARLLGSTECPDIDAATQPLGVSIDGFTDRESSAIVFTSLVDDVAEVLPIITACMFSPSFDSQKLAKEMKVVAGAVCMRSHFSNWSWARLKMDDMLFGADELMSLGSAESLSGIDRDRLVEWHERFDHPSNVRLLVAGDLAQSTLHSALGTVPDPGPAVRAPEIEYKAAPSAQYLEDGNGGPPELYLGFRTSSGTFDPAVHLLRTIVGNYPGSRLWRGLRTEDSLAYTVDADLRLQTDGCRLALYAGLSDPGGLPPLWRKLTSIIRDLLERGPTDVELAWAKRVARIELLRSLAGPEQAVQWLRGMLCSDWEGDIDCSQFVSDFEADLLALTREQVRKAAAQVFRRDQAALSVVGITGAWDPDAAMEMLPA